MSPNPLQLAVAGLFATGLLALAVVCEVRLIRRIWCDGGQVRTDQFRMPDALVALVLAMFFIGLGVAGVIHHGEKGDTVKVDQVLPSALLFLAIAGGIAGFLKYRGLKLIPLFGFDRLSPLRIAGWALGLVLIAFALAGAANVLTVAAMQGKQEPQPLVQLFRDVAGQGDYLSTLKIFIAGVILAPVCEEFIFRGFFYAVGKRYMGAVRSGFATALLFAAFHLSLSALAGLFILAVCLTLAYERTGSLLVPIGMHALFNFTSLSVIYLQARGSFPAP